MSVPSEATPIRRKVVWQEEGLCLKADRKVRESFTIFKGGRPSKDDERKTLCGQCPVRAECSAFAIVHDEYGIWGGMTKGEREKLPKSLKNRLIQKAVDEGWYLPVGYFLAEDYTLPQPQEEFQEGWEDQIHPQEAQSLAFFLDEVPAFSL